MVDALCISRMGYLGLVAEELPGVALPASPTVLPGPPCSWKSPHRPQLWSSAPKCVLGGTEGTLPSPFLQG